MSLKFCMFHLLGLFWNIHSCIVWAPYYAVHVNRIECIQRRFMRFCLRFLPWSSTIDFPPYTHRLQLINLPSLLSHREYLQFCFIMGIVNGTVTAPSVLCRLNFSVSRSSLRRQLPLCNIFSRSNYGANSPLNLLINVFNKNYFLIHSINDNVKSHNFKNMFFILNN